VTLHSVTSERLSIGMAHEADLRADLEGNLPSLGPIAPDWPPLHWDKDVLRWSLVKLADHPTEPLWRPWFIRTRDAQVLIGTCGFKGPADREGQIEVGYGVVASRHRQGIASEAVGMLLQWAWRNTNARVCLAHTLPGDPASSGVLRKNGFSLVGQIVDPNDGPVDRWRKARA